jgi:ubiquinone biosynthesis protein UbiJ
MLATLALSAFESVLNEWIDLDAATRQGFDQLAGQLLRVQMDAPHLSIDTLFDQGRIRLSPTPVGMDDSPASSLFEQRACDLKLAPTDATTTLHVPHLVALARLLGATPGTTGNLPVQGDMALLQRIQQVMAQAEPDISGKLSPWIGDTLAGQLSALLSQGKQTLQRTSSSLFAHAEDTLKEDSGLLAPRWQAERFIDGVRDLRNDVERLQARLRGLPTSSNDDDQAMTPSSQHPSQQQQ